MQNTNSLSVCSPARIAELLGRYGAAPLKKLGQNFLIDENIVRKIAQAAVLQGENVLEIGPGLGALTLALSDRAKRVVAVEIDRAMVSALDETLSSRDNTQVIQADFLQTDVQAISSEYFYGEPFVVVGNLPYYITAKCILHVLESNVPLTRFTAMIQKEVAYRLCAEAGTPDYGALTASVGYYGKPSLLFNVSANCFYPRPEVTSTVFTLVPSSKLDIDREQYTKVVRALFSMRRKTAANNMRQAFDLNIEQAQAILESVGISKSARAEELSVELLAELAKQMCNF